MPLQLLTPNLVKPWPCSGTPVFVSLLYFVSFRPYLNSRGGGYAPLIAYANFRNPFCTLCFRKGDGKQTPVFDCPRRDGNLVRQQLPFHFFPQVIASNDSRQGIGDGKGDPNAKFSKVPR